MTWLKKYKGLIFVFLVLETGLQSLALSAQNPSIAKPALPTNLTYTTPTAIQKSDLKLSPNLNKPATTSSPFYSLLKFPVPLGMSVGYGPTKQPDGSTEPTQCDNPHLPGNVTTRCPNDVFSPSLCPYNDFPLATTCTDLSVATHCYYDENSPTIPTSCRTLSIETIPTYCPSYKENSGGIEITATECPYNTTNDGEPISIQTYCPDEAYIPTECPDQKVIPTQCSRDDNARVTPTHCPDSEDVPTYCPDDEVMATECPYEEVMPTVCPNGDVVGC